jgi:lactate dehydrogenase-like 2-hydroxyacid dehydrogenase
LISKLNSDAIIISTSDISVFDDKLILSLVEKEKLGGFSFESNLVTLNKYKSNVMVFPEQAFCTQNTLENIAEMLTNSILGIIKGKPLNKIN